MKGRAFWNLIARRYARAAVADTAAYERKMELTRAHLSPDMRLLELGCGTGSTALVHAPYVARIEATDYAPRMIDIAREKAKAAHVNNVTFSVAPADAPPFDAGSFDAVLALNLIHLMPDPAGTVRVCRAMRRPGGVCATSTPALGDGPKWLRLLRYVLPVRLSLFSQQDLHRMIEDAGFTITESWTPSPKAATFIIAHAKPQEAS